LNGIDITIFWSKCDSILIRVIGAGGHRMGFTPSQVRSCRVWRILYLYLWILGWKFQVEILS